MLMGLARHRWLKDLSSLVDQRHDLTLLRETIEAFLGKDQFTVGCYLEHAATSGLQVEVFDLTPIGMDKLFRQTDGIRSIVSNDAELDRNIHPYLTLSFI
jgi:hypothetical protein